MKSRDLNILIRQEMVNRFQSVVKTEIKSHNDAILSYREKLQNFEDKYNYLINEFKELKNFFNKTIDNIEKEARSSQEKIDDGLNRVGSVVGKQIREHEKYIEDVKNSVSNFCSQKDLESISDDLKKFILSLMKSHDQSMMSLLNQAVEKFKKMDDKHVKFHEKIQENQDKLNDSLSHMNKRLDLHSLDYDGFFRALNAYKKTVFLNCKKIEFLHTRLKELESYREGV